MAIEPIKVFQNGADNSIASLFQGGANVLTGILNNAVQVGRDISNKQLQQEQDLLGMRRQEQALQQRRGENLQQNWEDLFRFNENQRQFDTKFNRGVVEADRLFGANREDQAWRAQETDQNQAIQAAQYASREAAAERAGTRADKELALRERAQTAAEQARAEEKARQAKIDAYYTNGGNAAGSASTGDLLRVTQDPVSGDSTYSVDPSVFSATPKSSSPAPAYEPTTKQGKAAALRAQADDLKRQAATDASASKRLLERGMVEAAKNISGRSQEAINRAHALTVQAADVAAADSGSKSYAGERSQAQAVVEANWKHFTPNEDLKAWNKLTEDLDTAIASKDVAKQQEITKARDELTKRFQSNLFDRTYGTALTAKTFDEYLASVGSTKQNPQALDVLKRVWNLAHPGDTTAADPASTKSALERGFGL